MGFMIQDRIDTREKLHYISWLFSCLSEKNRLEGVNHESSSS